MTKEEVNESGNISTTTTTTTTTTIKKVVVRGNVTSTITIDESGPVVDIPTETTTTTTTSANGASTPAAPNDPLDDPNVPDTLAEQQRSPKNRGTKCEEKNDDDKEEMKGKILVDHDDPNGVYIGLRVYTHKDVPAVIVGRLKTPAVLPTTPAAVVLPTASSA